MINSISPRVAELVLCITKRYKLKEVHVYYAPTTSYSEEDIHSFYNDVYGHLEKQNHYTIVMGDFNTQMEKNTLWKRQRQILVRNEKRKRQNGQHQVQNHEYHVSEESREEMDVEKPKRCNEDRNLLHPNNKQARNRHWRNSHQPSQHWKWPQKDYEQHQTGKKGEKCLTKRSQIGSKKIEFQFELRNRFETLQEHQHHERKHHIHDPTKRIKNG